MLPGGDIPANPAEMPSNQQLAGVLEALSQRYDYIVVDAPPVLPVADTRILSTMCDATLLVLRS